MGKETKYGWALPLTLGGRVAVTVRGGTKICCRDSKDRTIQSLRIWAFCRIWAFALRESFKKLALDSRESRLAGGRLQGRDSKSIEADDSRWMWSSVSINKS